MKYIITESKVESFFNYYIKNNHPHFFNLVKRPLYKGYSHDIYGYEFLEPNDQIYLYFQYFWEDEYYDYTDDEKQSLGFPKLAPSSKLISELKGMFGEKSYDLFKNWFEETYKLHVNTVKKTNETFNN